MAELIGRLLPSEPPHTLLLPPDATRAQIPVQARGALVLLERDDARELAGEPSVIQGASLVLVHGGEGDDRAWLERSVKSALLSMLRGCLRDEGHPLRAFGVETLDLDEVASRSADPLDVLCIVAHAIEHRLAYAAQGVDEASWRESLRHAWRMRQIARIQRLPASALSAAIDLLMEAPGSLSDEAFAALKAHWLVDGTAVRPRPGALLRGAPDTLLVHLIEQHLDPEVWSEAARAARDALRSPSLSALSLPAVQTSLPVWQGEEGWQHTAATLELALRGLTPEELAQGEALRALCVGLRRLSEQLSLPLPERRAEIERLRASVASLERASFARLRPIARAAVALLSLQLSSTREDLGPHPEHLDSLRRVQRASGDEWALRALVLGLLFAAGCRVHGAGLGEPPSPTELLQEARALNLDASDPSWRLFVSNEMTWIESVEAVLRGALEQSEQQLQAQLAAQGDDLAHERQRTVLWGRLADIWAATGRLEQALKVRQEKELPVFARLGDAREEAVVQGRIADILEASGRIDEGLALRLEKVLPVFERLGEDHGVAGVWGKIADAWLAKGELDKAETILQERVLPAFERLGDPRGAALCWGKLADIHEERGEMEAALAILRGRVLPVFARLGDARGEAVFWGKIASLLEGRGAFDDALKIRREKQLPVFARIGDAQNEAVTWAHIAGLWMMKGKPGEALSLWQEKALPVFERLGSVREQVVCRTNIALALLRRRQDRSDLVQAREHLTWAYQEARAHGLPSAPEIAATLKKQGWPLPA